TVEAEHLLDAEPGDHLRFHQHNPEDDPYEEIPDQRPHRRKLCLQLHPGFVIEIVTAAAHPATPMIQGRSRCVISRPPAKNPTTAIREGSWRSARPMMACPEVQPPA